MLFFNSLESRATTPSLLAADPEDFGSERVGAGDNRAAKTKLANHTAILNKTNSFKAKTRGCFNSKWVRVGFSRYQSSNLPYSPFPLQYRPGFFLSFPIVAEEVPWRELPSMRQNRLLKNYTTGGLVSRINGTGVHPFLGLVDQGIER